MASGEGGGPEPHSPGLLGPQITSEPTPLHPGHGMPSWAAKGSLRPPDSVAGLKQLGHHWAPLPIQEASLVKPATHFSYSPVTRLLDTCPVAGTLWGGQDTHPAVPAAGP